MVQLLKSLEALTEDSGSALHGSQLSITSLLGNPMPSSGF